MRPLPKLPIGVLVSGQGTNLGIILDHSSRGVLAAEVRVVLSNRPSAPALELSRALGIPTLALPREDYPDRVAQQHVMKEALLSHGVDLVVLAGFDQILTSELVDQFSFRILNLHPSLLPAFGGGMHAVRDALQHGAKVTGCTVHFVATDYPETDTGPILLQEAVPIREDDDEQTLLARIHEVEHRLLPAAIQLIAEGRVQIEGRRVRILSPTADDRLSLRSIAGQEADPPPQPSPARGEGVS